MKKRLYTLLIFGFLLVTFFSTTHSIQVFAAGTDSTNDVTVKKEGDVLFLTTTATYSADKTASVSAVHSTNQAKTLFEQLHDTKISIPKGFATNISDLLNAVLSMVMLLGALLVFLQLILAGFYWITSGGDKGKVEAARQRLVAAIIGLIVLASSFAILTLGLNFLGFSSLEEVFRNTKTIS